METKQLFLIVRSPWDPDRYIPEQCEISSPGVQAVVLLCLHHSSQELKILNVHPVLFTVAEVLFDFHIPHHFLILLE